jgi:hypothetical protein
MTVTKCDVCGQELPLKDEPINYLLVRVATIAGFSSEEMGHLCEYCRYNLMDFAKQGYQASKKGCDHDYKYPVFQTEYVACICGAIKKRGDIGTGTAAK